MAGWQCKDRDKISWDGIIQCKGLISNQAHLGDGTISKNATLNILGDLYIDGVQSSPFVHNGGGIVLEPFDTGVAGGGDLVSFPYATISFNPDKRTLTNMGTEGDVILRTHKYNNVGVLHEHFSVYTSNTARTSEKRLDLNYGMNVASWSFQNSNIVLNSNVFVTDGKVGIGTVDVSVPDTKLSVFQSTGAAGDLIHLRDTTDTQDLVFRYNGDNYELRSEINGAGNLIMSFNGSQIVNLTAGEACSGARLVRASRTENNTFLLCGITDGIDGRDQPIGITATSTTNHYNDGDTVPIVISGKTKVYVENTTTRGDWIQGSATTSGALVSATYPPAPADANHWRECGHVLESGASGSLVNAIVHFN